MASRVLSLRVDGELWDRIHARAAARGTTAQDYVLQALVRDDFDERFKAAAEETERFYGAGAVRTGPDADPGTGAGTDADPRSRPGAGVR
ncbi:hypothetical protein [Actinacidiphila sp. ITFR-21]|uniref:hypothetical protein n=1 Tax=Actinacidiphila sp. ITFR-21 TaxID=3075199 RepID=UPI00288A1AA6|nr:hypothetical protein [Streptomyces sp. ITFR-21]WNI15991.1 hypothetical protein RLT57_10965 [Streptomyces sp. ITFR-21]